MEIFQALGLSALCSGDRKSFLSCAEQNDDSDKQFDEDEEDPEIVYEDDSEEEVEEEKGQIELKVKKNEKGEVIKDVSQFQRHSILKTNLKSGPKKKKTVRFSLPDDGGTESDDDSSLEELGDTGNQMLELLHSWRDGYSNGDYDERLQVLIRKGIPEPARGVIWPILTGAADACKRDKGLYFALLRKKMSEMY